MNGWMDGLTLKTNLQTPSCIIIMRLTFINTSYLLPSVKLTLLAKYPKAH